MGSGTPERNSSLTMGRTSTATGTELHRRMSRLVLLGLGRPGAHQGSLLRKPLLNLMLLSPLLHLRHLVLLSLGQISLCRPGAHHSWLLRKPLLRLPLLRTLLHLRHLVLLSLGQCSRLICSLLRLSRPCAAEGSADSRHQPRVQARASVVPAPLEHGERALHSSIELEGVQGLRA